MPQAEASLDRMLEDAFQLIDSMVPDLGQVLAWLDFGAVGVFAITGALVAARARQDIVTHVFFGVLSGVGGGTVRDLLIGAPVFWIAGRGYLEVCLACSVIVFLLDTKRWPSRVLTWIDAVGLSAYCVIGTLKALQFQVPPVGAAAMGVITAAVGGVLRDMVAMRPSILLTRELYVTAAVVGAGLTVILIEAGLGNWQAGVIATLVAFGTRAGALLYGWAPIERRDRE